MQRYFHVLLDEIAAHPDDSLDIRPLVPFKGLTTKKAGRLGRALELYAGYPMRALFGRKCDVVHFLAHGTGHMGPFFRGKPATVATVHDLIPLTEDSGLSKAQVTRVRARYSFLKRCDMLVAVSKHTAGQIEELLGIESAKIQVVHNGVDYDFFANERALPAGLEPALDRKYILSVSSALPRKNLKVLPAVLSRLASSMGEKVTLVRAGEALPSEIRAEVETAIGAGNLHELGRVSDETLASLYQHAGVFLFMSLQEGFGLPILEAMAAGCPVVCSNTTCLPEVGGDAVLYSEPMDEEQAGRQICRALGDDGAGLVEAGRVRARAFSWTKHVQDLRKIYQRLH